MQASQSISRCALVNDSTGNELAGSCVDQTWKKFRVIYKKYLRKYVGYSNDAKRINLNFNYIRTDQEFL